MRRFPIVLAASIAAACSASSGAHPEPDRRVARQPVIGDSVATPTRDSTGRLTHRVGDRRGSTDLSGAWATGSAGEPTVRRIVVQLSCNYTPAVWIIEQSGDTVRAWTNPESRAQGIAAPPRARPIAAEGRFAGDTLTMSDATSRYVLHYDPASEHLRGTLNGAPFWAVREERVRATGCIPVP